MAKGKGLCEKLSARMFCETGLEPAAISATPVYGSAQTRGYQRSRGKPLLTLINDDLNLPTKLSGPQVQKTCSFIESLRDLQNLNNESMDLSEPRVLGAQLEAEGEIKNSKEIVQLWHEMIDQLYVVIEGTWILSGKSKWEFDLLFEEVSQYIKLDNFTNF
ncbi:hypothetical protein PPACK8108_LOCUS16988 [Phakopsora pachyrhizi]|uniref:Uncharacterized protein n=1 Tax=Phakopsora pachyrhizi TaxID=170000 RepID=A0AAV0B8Z3_PHAPC|nr:hypothetical protein PPACK8108_LOCUS16988 [Phakopsora pachyrhizi]